MLRRAVHGTDRTARFLPSHCAADDVSAAHEADLADLSARWVAFLDVSASTARAYGTGIRQYLAWCVAHGIQGVPGREAVLAFRDDLAAAGRAASTVALRMAAVRGFHQWLAVEFGLDDPTVRVRSVKGRGAGKGFRRDALSVEQCRAVLAGCDASSLMGLRDRALILLAVTSGLRTCEIARARVCDLRAVGGRAVLSIWGKGRTGRDEDVAVSSSAAVAIRAYLDARGPVGEKSPLFAGCSPVAMRNVCSGMRPDSVGRIVKRAMRRAGLDDRRLSAHSLRHACATLALRDGAPVAEIQQLLRHAGIGTTMRYVHMAAAAENSCAERVGALLA